MDCINIISDGAVLTLQLNRPEVYNSFNRQMALELQSALKQGDEDPSVRAIVITGNGKAFSSGQDLKEAIAPDGPSLEKILLEHYNPVITGIRNNSKPVIAAVNGVAAGAGANIALACDVVLAARSASFIQAFSRIGLIPDSGGTFFLPRLIGIQRALALMMTGDAVGADEALNMGLVYRVAEDEQFADETSKLARRMAAMPTKALSFIKSAVRESLQNSLEEQLQTELRYQIMAGATKDFREGVDAFLEKRKPVFTGQ